MNKYHNSLTPCSTVLLEKLTGSQPIKKFPAFYGAWSFITIFTWARHLSYHEPDQSNPRHHSNSWTYNFILSSHLRLGLPSGLFPSYSPTKILYALLLSPMRVICPAPLILLDLITRVIFGEACRSLSSSLCSLHHFPATSPLLRTNILLSNLFSPILSLHSSLNVSDQVSHPYKTRDKIIYAYILIFIYLDCKLEDTRIFSEAEQAFPDCNLLLISSWMEFWFVTVIPRYTKSSILSPFPMIYYQYLLRFCPAFWSTDETI